MAILEKNKRLLLAKSGGFCQNPECRTNLFVFFADGSISSIEELAHVVGKSVNGPRANAQLAIKQRDEYDNIILLCPNCHTTIDKNPDQFPVQLLLQWKTDHANSIDELFETQIYPDRRALHETIHNLLRTNKTIFDEFGPHSSESKQLLSDSASEWKTRVIQNIIPNNRNIREIVRANIKLLNDTEKNIFELFVLHSDALEYNHLSGDKRSTAPLFPEAMNSILEN